MSFAILFVFVIYESQFSNPILTPFLLEKLTGFQPVKKFPIFYGTQRFITTFTTARYISLY